MRVEAGCGRPSDSGSSLIESIDKYVCEAVRQSPALRSTGDDFKTSIKVLVGIDLKAVFPMFRHGFAIQTLQAILKDKDWESARVYLDSTENLLAPENASLLRGLLAHSEGATCIDHAVSVDALH